MKKLTKKLVALTMTAMMVSFTFVGCGTDDNGTTEMPMDSTTTNGTDNTTDGTTNGTNDTTVDGDVGTSGRGDGVIGDMANGVGDAVGDVANGIGNAVGDVANGIGNAVGDVVNGGFESYEDAHDYLLGQLGAQDNDASYEVRNVKKETVAYQDGHKGYEFEVHDTRNGSDKKFGTFYVDEKDGRVYKMNENGNGITAYPFS